MGRGYALRRRKLAVVKPPFPYFGGKITKGPAIAALLPPHRHYVEPFCGSLAVLLAKTPSKMETVNDLDGALMTFWRVLRDQPADFARACALTPHSRAELHASYNLDDCADVEVARRVWVQLTQGRASQRRSTGWRYYIDPAGSGSSMPDYLLGYVKRLAPAAERLAAVSLECRPALDLVAKYGSQSDVLLYCDPPYLGDTRPASMGGYTHEMPSESDHRQLADALRAANATVVLSGYPSDLYDDLYGDWYGRLMPSATGQGGTWQTRTEALWSNRPFDPGYAIAFDL